MPTLSFNIDEITRSIPRGPRFYVSRNKFSAQGTQGQSNVIPLISEPRSLVSRYSRAVVENITINIDDQANIATVTFSKDLHDSVSGNIVGDEIKIRLSAQGGFGSEVVFRGIVLQPNFEISPSSDGITYDCIGYRYLLNADVIFGIRKFSDSTKHDTFVSTIFNEDDKPDRSAAKKVVNGFNVFLFDKENKDGDAKLWTIADILQYIFVVEVQTKIPTAVNVPENSFLDVLDFIPKHFELQNEQIATAITRTLQQMGPSYHWWLDDFRSFQGGAQSNFKWFIIGGENTSAGERVASFNTLSGNRIPNSRDVRRVFTIGQTGFPVDKNPDYNVGTMNITEDGSDVVNRLIVIGDFVRVETVFQLVKDWTGDDQIDFKDLLPDGYPGIEADSADPEDVTQLKTALANAKFENVFRWFKLDANAKKEIFDDIEQQLDDKFGKPKDINGKTITWFNRDKLPAFDRELFTQQEDINGNKKDIRMQVYGFTDARRKDDKFEESRLIDFAFGSWTLGTHRGSYIIDPEQPRVKFKNLVANASFSNFASVYVTVVIPTQVKIFHDTGKIGDVQYTVTRILEDERFKKILRFKSIVPERQVENKKPTSFKAPTRDVVPILIADYKEEDVTVTLVKKETGYNFADKANTKTGAKDGDPTVVRDDTDEMIDFATDYVDALKDTEIGVSIRVPFADAGFEPGQLIRRVNNSKFKRFNNSTIVGVSLNGRDFSTEIEATNKEI